MAASLSKAQLSTRVHVYVDYTLVVLLAFAPALFHLSRGAPRLICYVLAVVHFFVTFASLPPQGVDRSLPLPVHRWLELATAVALAASPWLLAFSHDESDRNFFLGASTVFFVVWLLGATESVTRRR